MAECPLTGELKDAFDLLDRVLGPTWRTRVSDTVDHPHDHRTRVPGCFRCELSADETKETTMPSEPMTDDDLAHIEGALLGPAGTVYGDEVLALVAEVRWLRSAISDAVPDTIARYGGYGNIDVQDYDNIEELVVEARRIRSERSDYLQAQVRRLQEGIRQVADDLGLSDPYTTTVHEDKLRDLIGDDT